MFKKIMMLITILSFGMVHAKTADLIISSYDRPMQLYAYLESIDRHMKDLGRIFIIYRTSSDEIDQAYQIVFETFKHKSLGIIHQGRDPFAEYKGQVLACLQSCPHEYVMFGVDDIIVKDEIKCAECIEMLEKTGAHGFYLRLGLNITRCYTENIETPVPQHELVDEVAGAYTFTFKDGKGDWGYPSSLDMTIYRKADLLAIIPYIPFHSPNRLEGCMAVRSGGLTGGPAYDMHKKGLFYTRSKIVNVPLNLVQTDWLGSRNMGYPIEMLFDYFKEGLKIDIDAVACIENEAAHMEVTPKFIARGA